MQNGIRERMPFFYFSFYITSRLKNQKVADFQKNNSTILNEKSCINKPKFTKI